MNSYRYILEPYKGIATRHTCPACEHKRCFSRYIDFENKTSFPNHVGRCDREEKCGYHFTPKQYFEENPERRESFSSDYSPVNRNSSPVKEKETSYIDTGLVNSSLGHYQANKLFQYLANQFGEEASLALFKRYKVGSAKHWEGATVFWQTDINGRVRTGKVMLYDPETGKRVKQLYNHITWAHSLLKQEDFNLKQCFFGEHLLPIKTDLPVAIVESEKTALIASFYMPQFQWIATGGKHGCFRDDNLHILKNRKVILFPDLGAWDDWQVKSGKIKSMGIDGEIFDFLEKRATLEQRDEGYDIADFLLEAKQPTAILQAMIKRNPTLKKLIEGFGLVIDNSSRNKINPPKKTGFKL
ncbi:MAG: DUF6371 domain-containing protein [Prevotella sp.]|nr:DUF6371 domain-containing protein [Prevotella sp.]